MSTSTQPDGTPTRVAGVADQTDELFDVVDDDNNPISIATREQCHTDGLLHRSTHVFLFRQRYVIGGLSARTEMLLQRRSQGKTVGPGLWDVSVAEHLSAGEAYTSATARGLREELGLTVDQDELVQIREPYLSRQVYEDVGVLDHLFTATYAMMYEENRHGAIVTDGDEVEEAEWWTVTNLIKTAKQTPELFTRWLLIELANLNLIEVSKMITGTL